jgi:hypothetical protein
VPKIKVEGKIKILLDHKKLEKSFFDKALNRRIQIRAF